MGLTLGAMWKADPSFGLTLAFLAAAGKAAGGILADRFGWIRVTLLAILVAAPLTSFGSAAAPFVAVGTFLFQMAMPVTLAAVGRMFLRLSSFAFGLASLALLVGAVPTVVGSQFVLAGP
jgi:FSR family fosmidomycin resistance protein-like MFS transporter